MLFSLSTISFTVVQISRLLTLSWSVRSTPAFRSISTSSVWASSAAKCMAVWDLCWRTGWCNFSSFLFARVLFTVLPSCSHLISEIDVTSCCKKRMDYRNATVPHCQVKRSLQVLRANKSTVITQVPGEKKMAASKE